MKNLFIIGSLLIAAMFGSSGTAYGQELTSTIKGRVIDQESGGALAGATVMLWDSVPIKGTLTDEDGSFRMEAVPIGRQVVQVRMPSYETVTLSNLMVLSGKELDLEVEMAEKVMELDEVVITDEKDKHEVLNQMATVSSRTISIEEAGRYSGSFQDPARMAQNFAGVSGASDDRNDIIVRGNSPTGVLWRMEGIDIPIPNHFATLGTTGGPVSMLNINNLR
ncbi:MAG: carboxypeptidase-like regulatory domain-containing protein, partial [Bacteroidota bacterium]